MMNIDVTESFIQYIWEHNLCCMEELKTVDGKCIEIIEVGKRDCTNPSNFLNAVIVIDEIKWVGNVIVHQQSLQWLEKKLQDNEAYNNVILHVVAMHNAEARRTTGEVIPCFEIQYPFELACKYHQLVNTKRAIPCADYLSAIDEFSKNIWLVRMFIERIAQRYDTISEQLLKNKNNLEETLYIMISRSFGSTLNGAVFEQLAHQLPWSILLKHRDQLFQLESLLFGVAGFLTKSAEDDYMEQLQKEFLFLKHKYQLKPLAVELWKHHPLRPCNFPTIRIAQWAKMIHSTSGLFSKTINMKHQQEMYALLQVKASSYWDTHYVFGKLSKNRIKMLGKTTIDNLLINTIIPFIFTLGKMKEDALVDEHVIHLMEQIPFEKNRIISDWQATGWEINNAFDSQALIHLKKNYCDKKACLKCSLGHLVLHFQCAE